MVLHRTQQAPPVFRKGPWGHLVNLMYVGVNQVAAPWPVRRPA